MTANPLQIEAVIFDMDGLLIDSERQACRAWRAAAAEIGRELTAAAVHRTIGMDDETSRAIVLEALGGDIDVTALNRRRQAISDDWTRTHGMPLKDGARAMLDWVAGRGLKIAMATSSQRDRTAWKLEHAGLTGVFPIICTRDDVVHGKPAPDPYLYCSDRLGVDPARCLVFEDSNPGARAAIAAGMTVVAVPDTHDPIQPDVAAQALAVLTTLVDAPALLEARLA